ncbi:MAG: hypothetical protein AAB518_01920 [Patescibacteria group bacterium]
MRFFLASYAEEVQGVTALLMDTDFVAQGFSGGEWRFWVSLPKPARRKIGKGHYAFPKYD